MQTMQDYILFFVPLVMNLVGDAITELIETFQILTTIQTSLDLLEVPKSKNSPVLETITGSAADTQRNYESVDNLLSGELVGPRDSEAGVEKDCTWRKKRRHW